jgi:hypothetical protein
MSNQLSSEPRFPDPARPVEPRRNQTLLTAAILIGGLVLLFGVGALGGLLLVLLMPTRYEASEDWEAFLAYVVETSVLPAGERTAIYAQVRRLARECDPEEMTEAQLAEVLTSLQSSSVFVLLDVGGIEHDLVAESGLTPTEKEDWQRAVRRAARGVHLGKVTSAEFYAALPPGFFYETKLTDALAEDWYDEDDELPTAPDRPAGDHELRAALARLRLLGERAGVPDKPWTFDISDEFTVAVERALAVVDVP